VSARPAPRRFAGKPFAIGLAAFLIIGTALTTYFAWQGELARHRAAEAIEHGQPPP
jgi:hypothetical protein